MTLTPLDLGLLGLVALGGGAVNALAGGVVWSAAAGMAIGALAGGSLGGRLAGRVPAATLRTVVVVLGIVIAVVYFVK